MHKANRWRVQLGSAVATGLTCLSTLVFWRQVTLAEPMSPDVENLMPSLVTPMTTVSPIEDSSLTMRLNSAAGIRTLHTRHATRV